MSAAKTNRAEVEAAVAKHGSVLKAARALGVADVTVYKYLGRLSDKKPHTKPHTNGHAPAAAPVADAIASALKQHESRLREIEALIVERTFIEEQIGLLKMAQGILNPKPPAPVVLPVLPSPINSGSPEAK